MSVTQRGAGRLSVGWETEAGRTRGRDQEKRDGKIQLKGKKKDTALVKKNNWRENLFKVDNEVMRMPTLLFNQETTGMVVPP